MLSQILKKIMTPAVPLASAVTVVVIAALAPAPVSAQFLYPNYMMPKVQTPWEHTPYDSVLQRTWQGIYKSLVDDYGTGMVHRPKSAYPDDAVSEGISYGMFLALYMNDQAAFNRIWAAGEKFMWDDGEGVYNWHRNQSGGTGPSLHPNGPASDADQDIALLLIFADKLVERGIWSAYSASGVTYKARASRLLESIRTTMVHGGRYLLPGRWGSPEYYTADVKNPGYVAPAFYRVFAEFEPEHAAAWNALVAGSYDMVELSMGYGKGLLPDWCTTVKGVYPSIDDLGYNAYHDGKAMYRDAIRIYWRLATDYLWYKEPRAKTFLDNAMRFLEGKGGPSHADFFDMDGELLPESDVEVLAPGHPTRQVIRSRREHSHLTLGMWAAAAMGSGGPGLAKKYSDALLGFYKPGTNYWGHPTDPNGGRLIELARDVDGNEYPNQRVYEDTTSNEMYFDQFLAWFGASILAGNFTNVWEDLKDGVPQGPPTWENRPAILLPNWNIDAGKAPFTFTTPSPTFSRTVRWTVTLQHDETGVSRVFSDNSATVNVTWDGTNENGGYMPQGWYTLTLYADGLEHKVQVWLGGYAAGRNLMISNNRLLVDDFADGDVIPYIGKMWTVHTDADKDGGKSTAKITFGTPNRLTWEYSLNKEHWQFATLDWTTDPIDVRNGVVDTLVIRGSASKSLEVSLQLLSTDFSSSEYHYFHHMITLGTSMQTIRVPLDANTFTQRLDGSGKNFQTTLAGLTGIRFHVQEDNAPPSSGSMTLDSIIFAGRNLSALYTYAPPPAYLEPDRDPIPVGVTHRKVARMSAGHSIKRTSGGIRVTVARDMAGASVGLINVKGRVVRRMKMPSSGVMDITTRDLAAGMYFVEIRKRGVRTIRMPLGNIK